MKYKIYKNGQSWGSIALINEKLSASGGKDFKNFIESIALAQKKPSKVFEYLKNNQSSYIQVEEEVGK